MKKVFNINLNGHAYQIDEDAYELLHRYLERAALDLRDNPDRAEILSDLEQAIAEKGARFLGGHRSVLGRDDVDQILKEMGPVETGAAAAAAASAAEPAAGSASAASSSTAPKRLYRMLDGAWLAGVCSGLAAYFGQDATVFRGAFVILGLLDLSVFHAPTSVLIYIAMCFLVPVAHTSEERAAASGLPFDAQHIIEQSKRYFSDIKQGKFDRAAYRRDRREWRRKMRAMRHGYWRHPGPDGMMFVDRPWSPYVAISPVITFVSVLAFWVMAFAVLSLIDSRTIYHWRLPDNVPVWIGVVGIWIVYNAIVGPMQAARHPRSYTFGGAHRAFEAVNGVLGVVFAGVILWYAYTHLPEVRNLVDHLPQIFSRVVEWFRQLIESLRDR